MSKTTPATASIEPTAAQPERREVPAAFRHLLSPEGHAAFVQDIAHRVFTELLEHEPAIVEALVAKYREDEALPAAESQPSGEPSGEQRLAALKTQLLVFSVDLAETMARSAQVGHRGALEDAAALARGLRLALLEALGSTERAIGLASRAVADIRFDELQKGVR